LNKYKKFEENFNSFQFFEKTTPKTPYEKLMLDIPKPNSKLLTRHKINSNSIPDYHVNVIVNGNGSNNGLMSGVGCCVVFAIQVSFIF